MFWNFYVICKPQIFSLVIVASIFYVILILLLFLFNAISFRRGEILRSIIQNKYGFNGTYQPNTSSWVTPGNSLLSTKGEQIRLNIHILVIYRLIWALKYFVAFGQPSIVENYTECAFSSLPQASPLSIIFSQLLCIYLYNQAWYVPGPWWCQPIRR